MWDQVFSVDEYVYGRRANDFLRENLLKLKKKKVLCLAEGEGRNAIFLARNGFEVTAVDSSQVGLAKTKKLAAEEGVEVTTIHADLADFIFHPECWDSVISIFCHLPSTLRERVHEGVISSLKPGGIFLLEGYTPLQLELKTGGPQSKDFMLSLELLEKDLSGLDFLVAEEKIRLILEGRKHSGKGAVVQAIAVKQA